MTTYVHLWYCLAEFFLEWEMFQTEVVEKIKTNLSCSIIPPPPPRKSCRLWDNVEKHRLNFLRFHCNNGYANAPQCYVLRT
jgi:hypothetical protein